MGEGVTEASADAWLAAWEAQAARDGLQRDRGSAAVGQYPRPIKSTVKPTTESPRR
jgi:hypothetical protein